MVREDEIQVVKFTAILPEPVNEAVEQEAKAMGRSRMKQIEHILRSRYGLVEQTQVVESGSKVA